MGHRGGGGEKYLFLSAAWHHSVIKIWHKLIFWSAENLQFLWIQQEIWALSRLSGKSGHTALASQDLILQQFLHMCSLACVVTLAGVNGALRPSVGVCAEISR